MNLYVIYNSPTDYPDTYLVRRWEIGEDSKATAKNIVIIGNDLGEIRKQLSRMGLYAVPRDVNDDIKIVETWL